MIERKKISIGLSDLPEEAQKAWRENVERDYMTYKKVLEKAEVERIRARAIAMDIEEGRVEFLSYNSL